MPGWRGRHYVLGCRWTIVPLPQAKAAQRTRARQATHGTAEAVEWPNSGGQRASGRRSLPQAYIRRVAGLGTVFV